MVNKHLKEKFVEIAKSNIYITEGMAMNSMMAHVVADMPVWSLITPASIAPNMPPTSNKVDISALKVAPFEAKITKSIKIY